MDRKTIALPGSKDVDLIPILPILKTRQFQRLQYIKQLGLSCLVFPCANHTRWEHSMGNRFPLCTERAERWQREGFTSAEEAAAMPMAALLHDIGHGPLSHAVEALCTRDHNQNGLRILEELGPAIEACGADPVIVRALFDHTNPLHKGVSHRPLGTDKIDYLRRDASYTSEAIEFRLDDMLNYTDFIDEQLVIHSKIVNEVKALQSAYVYMHQRVYLRKTCLIIQRFLQQIIARAMAASPRLHEDALWQMTDCDLECELLNCPASRNLFLRLRWRQLPKVAVEILPYDVPTNERVDFKPIRTFHAAPEQLQLFERYRNPSSATALEAKIAQLAQIPAESVLFVPVVTPERFLPEDVAVRSGSQRLGSLYELYPTHVADLRDTVRRYSIVRVCVFEEYREKLAQANIAQEIFELLMGEL